MLYQAELTALKSQKVDILTMFAGKYKGQPRGSIVSRREVGRLLADDRQDFLDQVHSRRVGR